MKYVESVIMDEIVLPLAKEGKLEKMDDRWAEFMKSSAYWTELAHYERSGKKVPIALSREGPGDWGALWVGRDVWWVLETDPQWYMERIAKALSEEGYNVMVTFSGYSGSWKVIQEFAGEARARRLALIDGIEDGYDSDPDNPGWADVWYRVAGRCRPEAWEEVKAIAKGLFPFGITNVVVASRGY